MHTDTQQTLACLNLHEILDNGQTAVHHRSEQRDNAFNGSCPQRPVPDAVPLQRGARQQWTSGLQLVVRFTNSGNFDKHEHDKGKLYCCNPYLHEVDQVVKSAVECSVKQTLQLNLRLHVWPKLSEVERWTEM